MCVCVCVYIYIIYIYIYMYIDVFCLPYLHGMNQDHTSRKKKTKSGWSDLGAYQNPVW